MSEENIFTADPALETAPQNPVPQAPAFSPEVAEFVGEGKKYKSAEDALRSIPHAQTHIQRLEEELAASKAEVVKARAIDELLDEMRKQGTPQPQAASVQPSAPVDIDSAVEAALERKEALLLSKNNAETVINTFKATFGEQSEAQFIRLAQENGLSVAYLNNLAMTSPSAVLKLAGLTKSVQPSVPHSTSSVNPSAAFSSTQELSAKVKMTGASTREVLQAWKNAGLKAEKIVNP